MEATLDSGTWLESTEGVIACVRLAARFHKKHCLSLYAADRSLCEGCQYEPKRRRRGRPKRIDSEEARRLREEINRRLKQIGATITQLAAAAGLHRPTVGLRLAGDLPWFRPKQEKQILDALLKLERTPPLARKRGRSKRGRR